MTFRVDQKVVCVNATPEQNRGFFFLKGELIEGAVYTIRDFVLSHYDERQCIRLKEITRINDELGFWIERFRPVVEPNAEVSFTQGADPSSDQFDNRRKVRKKVAI